MNKQNALPPISECPRGEEQYVEFKSTLSNAYRVQYDYRTPEGKLFSCIAHTLEGARAKRDEWLKEEAEKVQS